MTAPFNPFETTASPEATALRFTYQPELGTQLSEQTLAEHRAQLIGLVHDTHRAHETHTLVQSNVDRLRSPLDAVYGHIPGMSDSFNAIVTHHEDAVDEQLSVASDGIQTLLETSDTPLVIEWIEEQVEVSRGLSEADQAHIAGLEKKRRETLSDPHRPGRTGRRILICEEMDVKGKVIRRYPNPRDVESIAIKDLLENQSHRETIDQATAGRRQSEGQLDRLTALHEGLNQERMDRLEALQAHEDAVAAELDNAPFGQPAADPEQDGRIAARLNAWGEELANMGPADSDRNDSLWNRTVDHVRAAQRRAMRKGPDETIGHPQFTRDRGVAFVTQDGSISTEYDDGSRTGADGVRRWPDGTEYAQNRVAAAVTAKEMKALADDEVAEAFAETIQDWEPMRTARHEAQTAAFATEHSERSNSTAQHDGETAQTAEQAVNDAESGRMAAIHEEQMRIMAANPDMDQTDARHRATTVISDRINRLTQAHTDAVNTEHASREEANITEYWRGWFGVTRPDLTGHRPGSVSTLPNGAIALRDYELNGRRGNWVLQSNGEARLYTPSGTVETYRPNGTLASSRKI